MRQNLFQPELSSPLLREDVKGGLVKQVLTGAITLVAPLARLYSLDANGAGRNVTMPSESANAGVECYIVNTAAGAFGLTIKASDGTTTVGQIDQNEGAVAVCDGTRWKIMVNAET